jgi:hypothetical protein
MFLEEAQSILINAGIPIGSFTKKKISLMNFERDKAYRENGKLIFNELIDLGAVRDGRFYFACGVMNNFFQFLHELIIFNHLLI